MKATIIFDNGGGITLQLGDYGHYYDNPKQAARDYNDYLVSGSTNDWEGHEEEALELDPTYDEISNGGYRVYNSEEIAAEVDDEDSSGWGNIDEFCVTISNLQSLGKWD